ncbi:ROK family protein [Amycolatopsis sp. 195334CR]|uniref:ROK family protein n=1 Tax=Amycolatopsis sp. 195334CR TaxID=2814588 RepID=UPI001A8ED08B|nr:ROK family protein [Amycolatopsis sp. 195334CR]MBN6034998.1 ROK family protein [Amycolatopsis sp. 195334CR]
MDSAVVALDIGGTAIKAALLDRDLAELKVLRQPTARALGGHTTAAAVAEQVVALTAELTGGGKPAGVGVVVPGIVDGGVAHYSSNLSWRDVPFEAILAERLGVPVAFDHDVRAGGLAEATVGAARGVANSAFLPVGTGIAVAIMIDGKPYASGGYAGEIGHADVGHGVPCACGAVGCLEAVASASAIGRRFAERTGRPDEGARGVVDAARAGDPDAKAVFDEAVDALARGLRLLTTVLAPEVVVLGGGLFSAGEFLVDPVREALTGYLTFQRAPELRMAELGDRAGCLGAGLLAWQVTDAAGIGA